MNMLDEMLMKILDFRKSQLEEWLASHNADPEYDDLVLYRCLTFDMYCLVPKAVNIEGMTAEDAQANFPYKS
jgi:hypothetical protein